MQSSRVTYSNQDICYLSFGFLNFMATGETRWSPVPLTRLVSFPFSLVSNKSTRRAHCCVRSVTGCVFERRYRMEQEKGCFPWKRPALPQPVAAVIGRAWHVPCFEPELLLLFLVVACLGNTATPAWLVVALFLGAGCGVRSAPWNGRVLPAPAGSTCSASVATEHPNSGSCTYRQVCRYLPRVD